MMSSTNEEIEDIENTLYEIVDQLTGRIYHKPVQASDQSIYERDVLKMIIDEFNGISPYTGELLNTSDIYNDHAHATLIVKLFLKANSDYIGYCYYPDYIKDKFSFITENYNKLKNTNNSEKNDALQKSMINTAVDIIITKVAQTNSLNQRYHLVRSIEKAVENMIGSFMGNESFIYDDQIHLDKYTTNVLEIAKDSLKQIKKRMMRKLKNKNHHRTRRLHPVI